MGWRRARKVLTSRAVTALTVPHGVDRYLGLINPLWSVNEVRAAVADVTHPTPSSVTLTLRPNGNWDGAQAGQYVRLHVEVDGMRRTRCFSVAGSAHRSDGLVEITAKVNPAGTVSGYLKRHARPGLVVGLSQAEGGFVLPAEVPGHVLLISGGSGITPVMSILRTLADRRHTGRITFLHYASGPDDVVYRQELAALAAAGPRLTLIHAYPRQHGRFSKEQLLEFAPDYADALCYCCGPPSLMDAVGSLWRAEGLGDRLRVERFTTRITAPPAGDPAGEVRFARSGVSVRGDGRTLLEQAESAGLRPDHGCRMGICHTCTSVKTSGAVRNVLDGTITAEPGERIQLCVNAPCGDVELDI
ncbi:ferredoxin reductase [Kibdelosporangium phytohabitans]|uniref:Ferredoxin reductase n=1 Tax=Kibdelosporangium phytohabitans TaxID=860235 RepID=A0A0N9I611_9PSEU|nr:ferredoxin reductase [Kibdelosporangium phytohabitans]ALG09876.1 ferredoxin reductase [Kibdelosporangium phytohabitans]